MTARYLQTLFTDSVKAAQEANGSRAAYARVDAAPAAPDALTGRETAFISARDSFYIASVAENGWPYLQHRGGPRGFVKILDERRLGFADYRGNRQYMSVGNVTTDPRVSLFFMDYPSRARLKLLGRMRSISGAAAQELAERLDRHHGARTRRHQYAAALGGQVVEFRDGTTRTIDSANRRGVCHKGDAPSLF